MWQLIILRAMPLVVTLALTILLPIALRKRSHDLAVSALILRKDEKDQESHEMMEYLLSWRDLITAIITGLFVLEFSVAEKIIEKVTSNHPVTGNQAVDWSIVIIIAIVLFMPLALVSVWPLTEKLGLRPIQSKRMYWFLFISLVVPWYIGSFLISYFL